MYQKGHQREEILEVKLIICQPMRQLLSETEESLAIFKSLNERH